MTTWDPTQYELYADQRLRPALDLIERIQADPAEIWDLGCGTGTITALLAERWPQALVHGLDSSPEMLDRARRIPGIDWVLGDIAGWLPDRPVDLIFSNATLHWLDDHPTLMPRLADHVAVGGVLAIQMPRNFGEPSHTLLAETASSADWKALVGHLVRPAPVAEPANYHRLLADRFEALDIWETTYLQVLRGENPVAEWARGTAARPFLDILDHDGAAFMSDYTDRLRGAYPTLADGSTLLPFKRLFLVGNGRKR